MAGVPIVNRSIGFEEVAGVRLYGLDAEVHRLMEAKRDFEFEKSLGEWIEKVVDEKLSHPDDIIESLRSGIILCKLVNKIRPGIVTKYNTRPIPLLEMENIGLYLEACWRIGVPSAELFVISDLYRRKGINQVFINLGSLARIASTEISSYKGPKYDTRSPDRSMSDQIRRREVTYETDIQENEKRAKDFENDKKIQRIQRTVSVPMVVPRSPTKSVTSNIQNEWKKKDEKIEQLERELREIREEKKKWESETVAILDKVKALEEEVNLKIDAKQNSKLWEDKSKLWEDLYKKNLVEYESYLRKNEEDFEDMVKTNEQELKNTKDYYEDLTHNLKSEFERKLIKKNIEIEIMKKAKNTTDTRNENHEEERKKDKQHVKKEISSTFEEKMRQIEISDKEIQKKKEEFETEKKNAQTEFFTEKNDLLKKIESLMAENKHLESRDMESKIILKKLTTEKTDLESKNQKIMQEWKSESSTLQKKALEIELNLINLTENFENEVTKKLEDEIDKLKKSEKLSHHLVRDSDLITKPPTDFDSRLITKLNLCLTRILYSSSSITFEDISSIDPLLLIDYGRRIFSIRLKKIIDEIPNLELSTGAFDLLLYLVWKVLSEMEKARKDYMSLKVLMLAATRLYRKEKIEDITILEPDDMQDKVVFLRDYVKDFDIWKDEEFWEEMYFESLMKKHHERASEEDDELDDDMTAGVLESCARNMRSWGVSMEIVCGWVMTVGERDNVSEGMLERVVANLRKDVKEVRRVKPGSSEELRRNVRDVKEAVSITVVLDVEEGKRELETDILRKIKEAEGLLKFNRRTSLLGLPRLSSQQLVLRPASPKGELDKNRPLCPKRENCFEDDPQHFIQFRHTVMENEKVNTPKKIRPSRRSSLSQNVSPSTTPEKHRNINQ